MTIRERMADMVVERSHGTTEVEMKEAGLRPNGSELFASLSQEEQDELIGPEKAQLVRDGKVELSDFVQRNPQDEGPDFITAKPLQDVDPDA